MFHRTQQSGIIVCGIGRLESGKTFAFADNREKPSFYIRESDVDAAQKAVRNDGEVMQCRYTTMDEEKVVKICSPRFKNLRQISERLHQNHIRTYEVDVSVEKKFLMERGILGPIEISGIWRPGNGIDRVYIDPKLQPGSWVPELSVLTLDIETLPDASQILAISLVGSGTKNVAAIEEIHIVGNKSENDPPELHCHCDESAMLLAFSERIHRIDPDIISGWNVVDFDLTVIQKRFRSLGLTFNLGRSNDSSWYQEGETWGRSRMVIYGRQVIDTLHLIRSTVGRYDDYRLETVSQKILGRGKRLQAGTEGEDNMPERILKLFRNNRLEFCDYCLEDARLVRDILRKEGLIELTLKRSCLTGLPLERAWASVAAFDFLYISQLRERNKVAPTTGVDRTGLGGAPGGLVMPAMAGLYRNVCVFDFNSLYPSIIRTFNIDPLAHVQAQTNGNTEADKHIEAPNGAQFARLPGILPQLLEKFFVSRAKAKEQGDDLASYAYKIVMNSFYGVLATDSCRFAEAKLAGAITEFGHYFLRWTRDLLENNGCRVLYGDTDSVFVDANLPSDISPADGISRSNELCKWINHQLDEHIKTLYGVNSQLELEFEKYYRRFLLPPTRDGNVERGRAKGYAGLLVQPKGIENIEIVGMEAIRRDWTDMAGNLQRALISLLFHDASAEEIESEVSEWLRGVRAGERDEELIYRKSLRKPIENYTRTNPPHVTAARMLPNPSGVIQYVITRDGPQPVGFVKSPLDYEHYIEKQIKPIVRTIGQVSDFDVETAITGMPDLFKSAK